MTTAFTSSLPSVPLGLAGNSQPQHAAPRRQPGSSAVTLRAGCIGIQHREPLPTHTREAADVARDPHRVPVSDQPVGHLTRRDAPCVHHRFEQAGRLIADASGTFGRRTGQHDALVPELRGATCNRHSPNHRDVEMSPWSGVALACDASDQGSGVWTTVRAHEFPTALIAGGVGQHGGAPLVHASSHEIESAEIIRREEAQMGMRGARPYLTETVMEEAEEAEDAVRRLLSTAAHWTRCVRTGYTDRIQK